MNETLWYWLSAGILGIVQGITEFLPISSSGHLVLAYDLLGIPDHGLFFDAVLHLGTLIAILIYFRKEWLQILMVAVGKTSSSEIIYDRKLLIWLGIATIPALFIGYFFQGFVENYRSIFYVSILLLFTGIALWWGDQNLGKKIKPRPLTWANSLSIGLAQALAIIPGISRSGSTILAGLYNGWSRETAARISFLLAAPAVAAAGLYSLVQSLRLGLIEGNYGFWLVAFVTTVLVSLVTIQWLLSYLQKKSLFNFSLYLIALGGGLLVYQFMF
ncbi:MAG: undecaprenyl-diphosphate phosphatase [Patescibacteria group bacterium]|nr:undecaprenyl-diphosphate phosphatase [Patescibacteria group bacterium]